VRPEAVALKIVPMRRTRKHTSAFTLIEILVVMTLIAILVGIGVPAFSSIMEQARKTQAKNEEQQIVAAVNAYYTEYGKYPVTVVDANDAFFGLAPIPPTLTATTTRYLNNDVLIDVLRNNTGSTNNSLTVATLNPRGIVFISPPIVKNISDPRSGVIPNGAVVNPPFLVDVWYDPWGSPYSILIDVNYNNQITNPYTDAPGDAPGQTTLYIGVIVWSFGKNGALGGGQAAPPPPAFTAEGGSANNFSGSGDVISWQ
jgi:prepilin-type N-terminal cleavage/methylation domain-containing protein